MERGNYAASASSSPFNDGARASPSSGFPTVFFICAISLLLFQGRSIKIQGRFDPLFRGRCVIYYYASFRCRHQRNAAAAAASDVQVKRRQLLARSPTANSSEISTSDQVRPPFLQRVALTMPGIHRARATLNVECGQDCEYFALENAGLSIHHSTGEYVAKN